MFQKRNKSMVLRWETSRLNQATKIVLQIPRLMRLSSGLLGGGEEAETEGTTEDESLSVEISYK